MNSLSRPGKNFASRRLRLAMGPGAVFLYIILLLLLYPLAGRGAFALSFLPVGLASFAGGRNWGLLMVALILPINYFAGTFLFTEASLPSSLMGALAQSLLALGIGHLRELRDRLRATIIEKDEAVNEARRFAFHDTVTGLPNRRLMIDRLERELAHVRMSVNIATAQLLSRDFPGRVRALLPALLELEVTETGIALHGDRGRNILGKIRETGVTIALDDFGVGNSSLRYLANLPIDTLKIDRSFVRRIHTDHRCNIITHTMVSMGKTLHLNVVAEGVETEAQRRAMFAMGCDLMQGYLFRPALPFAKVVDVLTEQESLAAIRFNGPESRGREQPVLASIL